MFYQSLISVSAPAGSSFFPADTKAFCFFFLGIQICVASEEEEEEDGFIRVLSGKKRGLVPLDVLENV
jgi:hypothetical protein